VITACPRTELVWGVLVVEDDPQLLALTGQRLRELGCRVWLAASATEAWEIYVAEQAAIDFVFTDLRLDEGSGSELVSRLIAFDPRVQVVAASALFEELDALRQTWGSRLRYLHKPYTSADLQGLLAVERRR
jgi:CheY-like chemotaxis protein